LQLESASFCNKLVLIFDFAGNCLHTHQLDIHGVGGTTEDGTLAIKHSIEMAYAGNQKM
jgi:hypothetical protein